MGGQGSLTMVGHLPPAPHPPLFLAFSGTPQIPHVGPCEVPGLGGVPEGPGAQAGTEERGPLGSAPAQAQ